MGFRIIFPGKGIRTYVQIEISFCLKGVVSRLCLSAVSGFIENNTFTNYANFIISKSLIFNFHLSLVTTGKHGFFSSVPILILNISSQFLYYISYDDT